MDLMNKYPRLSDLKKPASKRIPKFVFAYLDSGTGKVMRAIGNATADEATVVGFAKETKFANNPCDVQIAGILGVSGLSPGVLMYLSDTGTGNITATAPTTAGRFVVRVGEVAAANQLIREEQLKIYLEDLCVRLGHQPNKEFISTCCLKYKFAQERVEQYILKLFNAKTRVINECKKANLKMPNDTQLNRLILFYFGHWQTVLYNIREGL